MAKKKLKNVVIEKQIALVNYLRYGTQRVIKNKAHIWKSKLYIARFCGISLNLVNRILIDELNEEERQHTLRFPKLIPLSQEHIDWLISPETLQKQKLVGLANRCA